MLILVNFEAKGKTVAKIELRYSMYILFLHQ